AALAIPAFWYVPIFPAVSSWVVSTSLNKMASDLSRMSQLGRFGNLKLIAGTYIGWPFCVILGCAALNLRELISQRKPALLVAFAAFGFLALAQTSNAAGPRYHIMGYVLISLLLATIAIRRPPTRVTDWILGLTALVLVLQPIYLVMGFLRWRGAIVEPYGI